MTDFIIVGAGLSGIAVAERLLALGKAIRVVEDGSQISSKVAGGLINPVVLKRFTLAWKTDEELKVANSFYRGLENKLHSSFLSEVKIYRRFHSIEEQNNWFAAADKPSLEPFLDTQLEKEVNPFVPSSFSFGRVKGTAMLNTEKLLLAYKNYLQQSGSYLPERFDYSELKIGKELYYKNEKIGAVIFCEGFGLLKNPFFNYLPLKGNKGEYLIIKSENLKLEVVVKSSIFILPQGNDLYKVGATYNNFDKTPETTLEAKEYLLQELKKLITCDFKVVGQVAGLRPVSGDRRPIIGKHPEHDNLYCCNGFGSRGVLAAPTISKQLIDFIFSGTSIPQEVALERFKKRYFSPPS